MDNSIQYAHVMSNFDSVYNAGPSAALRYSPMYVSTSSFSSNPCQPISPCLSSSDPKFNFDLYQPNEYLTEFSDYPSPSSSVIIHHHPVYSPPPSQAISKLRQINDELCYTLAQSELPTYSQSTPPNYHVHHYPLSHHTHHSSRQRDSSTESESVEPQNHKARMTYKVHIPRRRRRQQQSAPDFEQLLASTSDAYAQDDPLTVDVYPTRDQGYVRRIRNRPDNRSPWLADSLPARRNSYSEQSTYRTPRAPDYENRPIQPQSRLSDCKERPRSSSVKSRFRRDTTPNGLRHSTNSLSATAPVWRPNGSIKRPKFVGSNAPPSPPKPPSREAAWNPAGVAKKTKSFRAFDPTTKAAPKKINEPIWHPPSKESAKKPLRYFEPTLKPEWTGPMRPEAEFVEPRKLTKAPNRVSSGNPQLKTRIANAESKVKSAWTSGATTGNPRPSIPRPATTTLPPKTKGKATPSKRPTSVKKVVPAPAPAVDTGRSSLTGVPARPLFHSTPRQQSIVEDDDDDAVQGMFGDDSQISVLPKKQPTPPPSRPIEKTPPKQPKTTVPEPDEKNNSTIKDGVLVHGDDGDSIDGDHRTPSPTSKANHDDEEEGGGIESLKDQSVQPSPAQPERKEPSAQPDEVLDEDSFLPTADGSDDDAGLVFDTDRPVGKAEEVNNNISEEGEVNPTTLPQRNEPSPTPNDSEGNVDPSFDNDSHLPAGARPPSPPAAAATTATASGDFDDFFN